MKTTHTESNSEQPLEPSNAYGEPFFPDKLLMVACDQCLKARPWPLDCGHDHVGIHRQEYTRTSANVVAPTVDEDTSAQDDALNWVGNKLRPEHRCRPLARAVMMEERDWWIGELLEPVIEWPLETHCLHMKTPLKDVSFLCNAGDFEQLLILSNVVVNLANLTWLRAATAGAKVRLLPPFANTSTTLCSGCGGSGKAPIGCAIDSPLTAPCNMCGGTGHPLRHTDKDRADKGTPQKEVFDRLVAECEQMPRRHCSVHNREEFKYESLEHELHAAAPSAATKGPTRREVGSSRHPHFTHEDHQRMKETLDALPDIPTEEEAEAVLQACGTSGKEVVNEFIERILRENLELKESLSAAKPSGAAREAARSAMREIREALVELNERNSDGCIAFPPERITNIIERRCFSAPAESVDLSALKFELDDLRKRLNQFHAEYERPIVVKDLKRLLEICDLLVAGLEAAGTPPQAP